MSAAAPITPEKLRDAMTVRKLGVGALAREAGVGINTVSRALAGRPLSIETRLRITEALARRQPDVEVERLLEQLA